MIYIRESYNTKGLLLEKTTFYLKALEEFVFDFNYFKKDNDFEFKTIDNGFEVYRLGRLWAKGYLVEKE